MSASFNLACRQDRSICTSAFSRNASASVRFRAVTKHNLCSRTSQSLVTLSVKPCARTVAVGAASEVAEVVGSAPEVAPEATTDMPLEPNSPQNQAIKVSKRGNVKLIAGRIAHCARSGDVPPVVCVGPDCTNIGVKAIAISRSYLAAEGIDLAFQPVLRYLSDSKETPALKGMVLKVTKVQVPATPSTAPAAGEAIEMHIRSEGEPRLIAGALAARIREAQQPVHLTAIGVRAVYRAVQTVEKARQYVRKDAKNLRVVPEFIKVAKDDREVNALKFSVVVDDMQVPEVEVEASSSQEGSPAAAPVASAV